MQKFIGRKNEYEKLQTIWNKVKSGNGRAVAIYGKRRVGKTTLVKNFIKDKDSAYYLCSKLPSSLQLKNCTKDILSKLAIPGANNFSFPSWRDFFDYLGEIARNDPKPRVIVLDEFPYLANVDNAISSLFQYLWDEKLKDTPTMLILMGSSVNMMYRYVLNHSSPLFNRIQDRLMIEPLNWYDAKELLSSKSNTKLSFEDMFKLYAVVGGFPGYLDELDVEQTFEKNLEDNILQKNSPLRVEPEFMITEDFSEPSKYLGILMAVGLRRTKYSQILDSTGLTSSELPALLKTLTEIKFLTKEIPITEINPETSKKGMYKISDNLFRFYFYYTIKHLSEIESDAINDILKRDETLINKFVSQIYEDSSKDFVKVALAEKGLKYIKFGRWHGKYKGQKENIKTCDVDLVGLDDINNNIIFVETKWSKNLVDTDTFYELLDYSNCVNWGNVETTKKYILISKSGFTDKMLELAKEKDVILVKEDQILKF